MRVGLTTCNVASCQPLRTFGKAQDNKPKSPEQYEKELALVNEKYKTACNIAACQAEQLDAFVKGKK